MPTRTKSQTARKRPSKILVYLADDEALLLDLAESALDDGKYAVRKFQNPREALQTFRRARQKPELLITDYAMGTMNGMQLIESCKRVSPEVKTILVSGTVGAETIVNAPVHVDRFMAKPYEPAQLAALVDGLMNNGSRK